MNILGVSVNALLLVFNYMSASMSRFMSLSVRDKNFTKITL